MGISELDPSSVTAWATVVLVGVTAWYSFLVCLTLKEMQKSREIELIQDKFEKFYSPLQNSISSIIPDAEDKDEQFVIDKAYALTESLKRVRNYDYLASSGLRKIIHTLPSLVNDFANPPEYIPPDIAY